MNNSTQSKKSPLHGLFLRQQPKLKSTPRTAALLKTFADEDHKKIAQLIKIWLKEDDTPKKQTN